MQAEARQRRIEEYLQQVEFASLDEISELVDASASTVRRDLTVLEGKGVVRRTHGGARLVNPPSDEFNFRARDTIQMDAKEAIGRACAELIEPGQSVFIDAGTTCFHVARHLESKQPNIITNSLPVAQLYASVNTLEVMVSGGVIYPRLGVLVGPLAVESFTKLRADVAIMSAGGITAEGITNSHGLLIDIQRAMMQSARRAIFCFDHSKFGRQSVSFLCGLEAIDTVVTDTEAPEDQIRLLKEKGVGVVVGD